MALPAWTDQQVLAQLGSGYYWSSSTITYAFATSSSQILTYSGEGTGFSALNSTQQARAELALRLWDDLISNDFARVSAGPYFTSTNIEFGNSTTGVGYAHAYYPTIGSVWFNSAYTTGGNSLTSPTIGRHGFLTFVHEIGHALGLDHMGEYNGSGDWTPSSYQDSTVYSVMSYFGPSWGGGTANGEGLVAWADWVGADGVRYAPQTPMLNDIMAMQAIYGVETTTRTGNTVYGFNSNIADGTQSIFNFTINGNPILTIFDSSGIDTLDLSGWSTGSVINLAPGSFSSGNSMTYNIAIAYSCTIENAVGGAGSDVITGNAVANTLAGGLGSDTIFGASGDDILSGQGGSDTIDGGDGADIATFMSVWAAISFSYNEATARFTVIDGSGGGTDLLVNVEGFRDSLGVVQSVDSLVAPLTIETAGAVDLIRSSSNRYYLQDGAQQILMRDPAQIIGPGSYSGWSAIQAERTDNGNYLALWKSSLGNYAVWTLDSTGMWISSTNINDVIPYEGAFGTDLNGDSFIGALEQTVENTGAVSLLASPYAYIVQAGSTRTTVTSSGSMVGPSTYAGWSAIHTEASSAGGYQLLWKSSQGAYAVWSVDAIGRWTASRLVADVRDVESTFGADVNGDGFIGQTFATIESAGTVSLLVSGASRYYLDTGSRQIAVSSAGIGIGTQTYSGWSAIHAEEDGGAGFNLLWRSSQNTYAIWHLDGAGAWDRSSIVSDLRSTETLFNTDLDGDGNIGRQRVILEAAGAVRLATSATGIYELDVGGTTIGVTSGGAGIGPDTYAGWSALHAEASGSGYELLWRSAAGRYAIWSLDSSGAWRASALISDVRDSEARFAADINGDGHIGHFNTIVEATGLVGLEFTSQGGYVLVDGASRISVTASGQSIGPGSYPGWQLIQSETGSSGYQVLWKSTSNAYAIWTLDAGGAWQSSRAVADVRDVEPSFAGDVNGDGTIGHVLQLVENAGRVDLLSSIANRYVIQDGSAQIAVKSSGTFVGPGTYSNWSAVHAEGSSLEGYDVLWRSTAGAYALWHVNASGDWSSSSMSSDTAGLEILFSADLNGDRQVGLSSAAQAVYFDFSHDTSGMTLSGGVANDWIVGGSGSDTIIGSLGNDTLGGGAGTDTFLVELAGGNDTILDFVAGASGDRLDLRALSGAVDPLQILTAASQQGSDTVLLLGGNGQITLLNVVMGDLRSENIIV